MKRIYADLNKSPKRTRSTATGSSSPSTADELLQGTAHIQAQAGYLASSAEVGLTFSTTIYDSITGTVITSESRPCCTTITHLSVHQRHRPIVLY